MFGFGRSNTDTPPADDRGDNAQHTDDGGIGIKSVLNYCYNPQLGSRFSRLGYLISRFAYTIAQIFAIARLIPQGHPYLNSQNIGKFGFKDVLAVGSANLYFTKENIHQIAVYFGVLMSMVISFITIILFLAQLALGAVNSYATPQPDIDPTPPPPRDCTNYDANKGFFETPNADQDCITIPDNIEMTPTGNYLADGNYSDNYGLSLLHDVFGVIGSYGFFRPVANTATWDNFSRTGFLTDVLHNMLAAYSGAMLVLAMFILLYIVVSVVTATVQTGVPFGKQFNSVWAPIRIAIGIGLLIPISGGLNSAQMLTLQVAKWGSGLGDKVWFQVQSELDRRSPSFIAMPEMRSFNQFVREAIIFRSCQMAHNEFIGACPDAGGVYNDECLEVATEDVGRTMNRAQLDDWLVDNGFSIPTNNDYNEVITHKFIYTRTMGPKQKVHDQCGSFNVPYHQYPLSLTNQGRVAGYDPMKARAQQEYGDAIEQLINHPALTKIARAFAEDCDGKQGCKNKDNLSKFNNLTYDYTFTPPGGNPQTTPVEYPSILYMLISDFMSNLTDDLYSDAKNEISDALHHSGGWAGAGSLFIQIAHINGQLAEAVNSGGDIESYSSESPEGVGGSTSPCTATQEFFSGDWFLGWNDCEPAKVDIQVARTIDLAQTWWGDEAAGDKRIAPPEDLARDASTGSKSVTASSAAKDYLIAKITPNHAFFNFDDNAGKNPLATLSLIGGSAIQWSTFTFGTAILADGFGYSAFSSALFFLGGVGFGAGFLLHYALPLLPYFYFFLAVLGFAISVFEAIMGMPLFALAHLDVNADGIVGKAKQGYVTLFLLLIEPVLIILALMASLLFFTAGIHFLNATFNVAVDVISGVEKTAFYDPVGGVSGSGDTSWYDWIIYTVLYAVFAFGVGNASFKLIDILPNKVIRWLGEQAELAGADSAAATNYLDKVALGAGAVAGNAIQQAGGLAGAAGKKLRGESQSQEIADGVAGGLRKAGETAAESPGDENT